MGLSPRDFPLRDVVDRVDPISGYFFILCIEILALALRDSKAYYTKKGNKHLQEQYADDLTVFLEYVRDNDLKAENLRYILRF